MSINRVILTGNLTRDPDIRKTAGGMTVMSFSIAVNERVKGADGSWSDRANFIDCAMFGSRAESVSRYISKGSKAAIEGKLRWSQWDDKSGGKRSKVEVVVDEIEFMSQGGGSQQGRQQQRMTVSDYNGGYAASSNVYDSDIPF